MKYAKRKIEKKNSKEKHFFLFRIRALYVQRNFLGSGFTNIQSQITFLPMIIYKLF